MRNVSLCLAAALLLAPASGLAPSVMAQSGTAGSEAGATGTAGMKNYQARELLEYYTEGDLTAEQFRGYSDEAFVVYDSDGDGYLSDEEWMVRSEGFFEEGDSSAEVDIETWHADSLMHYDSDADSRVSKEEWLTQNEGYYGSMDLNSDGVVDSIEVEAARDVTEQ